MTYWKINQVSMGQSGVKKKKKKIKGWIHFAYFTGIRQFHSTQSRSCTRYNCPIHTGAVCDNLLIACQIQINSDKSEILVLCHLCHDCAILDMGSNTRGFQKCLNFQKINRCQYLLVLAVVM